MICLMLYLVVLIAEADPDALDLDVAGAGDYGVNRDDEDDEPAPKKASRYETTICNSCHTSQIILQLPYLVVRLNCHSIENLLQNPTEQRLSTPSHKPPDPHPFTHPK